MTKLTSLLVVAGLAGAAHANGFFLNEFDAQGDRPRRRVDRDRHRPVVDLLQRRRARASATARSVMIGGSLIAPSASFTDTTGAKTDSTTSAQVVPGIFVTLARPPAGRGRHRLLHAVRARDRRGRASSPQANDVVRRRSRCARTSSRRRSASTSAASCPGLTVGAGVDLVPATVELTQEMYFGTDTRRRAPRRHRVRRRRPASARCTARRAAAALDRRDVAQRGQGELHRHRRLRRAGAVSLDSCRPTATSRRRSRCRSR